MRATISPQESSGEIVSFELGNNPYYSGLRRIAKQMTLDKSAVVYDFGFCAADSCITLSDIRLDQTAADRLIELQQSTTETVLWYSDGLNVYNIKLQQVTVKPNNHNKFLASITLCVVEKIT
jgi:hypothetical protein